MSARHLGKRHIAFAAALTLALGTAIAPLLPVAALAPCLPGLCPFSENGKKGRFLEVRVKPERLAKNDATLATGKSTGGLLAAQSVNRGELFATGLQMQQTERKLEAVIDRFRVHWKYRSVPPIKVRIVGSTSFVPNAFADNVVVVPLGILMYAKSDDQVAWLLAHEFSHIALAHFASEARAKKRKRTLAQIISTVDEVTVMSQARVDTSNNGKLRLYQVTDPDAVKLGNSVWAHSRILEDALLLGGAFFSRKDEDRADVMGVDLIHDAGFSRSEATAALEIIRSRETKNASIFDIVAKDTAAYAEKSGLAALGSAKKTSDLGAIGNRWLKDLADNALSVAWRETKKAYSAQHRPTHKRIDGIATYIDRAYPTVPEHPRSLTLLKEIRATKEYIEADRAVVARAAALDAVAAKEPVKATIALRPALATRYSGTPLIANVQAQIAEIQGDLVGADAAYTRAERLQTVVEQPTRPSRAGKRGGRKAAVPPPPVETQPLPRTYDSYLEQDLRGFQAHVALLVRMAKYPKALTIIGEAKRRFGDDQAFLPQYVAIYMAMNDNEKVAAALKRCIDTGEAAVEQGCRSQMLNEQQQKKLEQMSPADREKIESALDRTSSKARGSGFLSQLRDTLKAQENEEGEDES